MADFSDVFLLMVTFLVSTGASIISGMAGGGSGFIVAPFFMLIGLPPHLATATAKMNEVGVNASSIAATRMARRRQLVTENGMTFESRGGSRSANRQMILMTLFAITLINVLLAAWLIPRLHADGIRYIIGALLLLMIPTLFMNKKAFKPGYRSKKWRQSGYALYSGVSFLQALFGMGIGMFISLVLMYAFGMPVSEANDIKRRLMIGQSAILLCLLLMQGVVVLHLGLMALLGAILGGQIGTNIGIKKGNDFIKKILAVIMAISGVALFF